MYEYFEPNRNISKDAENFVNRLTNEFLTYTSSLMIMMINAILHLKKLILKLDKISCKKSF